MWPDRARVFTATMVGGGVYLRCTRRGGGPPLRLPLRMPLQSCRMGEDIQRTPLRRELGNALAVLPFTIRHPRGLRQIRMASSKLAAASQEPIGNSMVRFLLASLLNVGVLSFGTQPSGTCAKCHTNDDLPAGVHCYASQTDFANMNTPITSGNSAGHQCPSDQFPFEYNCAFFYTWAVTFPAGSTECRDAYAQVCCT